MNEIMMFFEPLNKDSCIYFLIIAVIFFIALVLVLASEIIYILQNMKNLNFKMFSNGVLILFNLFLAYFVNRLLYSMCVKSLN